MDVRNLSANYPKLIKHMEESGYSQRYMDSVENEIKKIIASADDWESYQDIYKAYDERSSRRTNREMRVILGAIMQFDLHGKFPDGKSTGLVEKSVYTRLIQEFKKIIDYYLDTELNRKRIKEITVKRNAQCASEFFEVMQNIGIANLNAVTEEAIISFYVDKDGKWLRTGIYSYCIRDVLRTCESVYGEICQKLIPLIPVVRNPRKNICYLTPPEAQKIRKTLKDMSNNLSLRDRAFGMLVYYTGLRGCDVVNLSLDSIDWDKDIINVMQQKTSEPLELPLTPIVGNAIHDYLENERPKTEETALFLTSDRNPRKLGKYHKNIADAILKAADIRQNKGDRKGFYIFRHHFTTTLLAHNVPQPVISATLGHLDPDSLEHYAHADMVNLRKCSLSIEAFSRASVSRTEVCV